jgi:hypothetical protein
LHDTIRTHGRPAAMTAGNDTTLSSTIASGSTSPMISSSRGLTYFAPSIERLPGRGDETRRFCSRVLAEDRRGVPDEIDPRTGRHLGLLGRRPETHQPFFEAFAASVPANDSRR